MLSHMFSFMRQSKKMRSQAAAAGGGIYLDDLDVDSLDPELARLYITQSSFHQKLHSSEMNCPSRCIAVSQLIVSPISSDAIIILFIYYFIYLFIYLLILCRIDRVTKIQNRGGASRFRNRRAASRRGCTSRAGRAPSTATSRTRATSSSIRPRWPCRCAASTLSIQNRQRSCSSSPWSPTTISS